MKFFTVRRSGREIARQAKNRHFTEPPDTLHYKPSHFTEPQHHIKLYTKQTTIVAEEALFPIPLVLGRISKCFDTAVWTFLSSSPEQRITYTC